MFSFFHSTGSQIAVNVSTTTGSQIAVNVSTTTVTTTVEHSQLPLSPTLSSNSEDTMAATEDKNVGRMLEPDLKQQDDLQESYPYFPTHPFRNPRHALRISTAKSPPPTQLFAVHSDPCPFPSPPSPPLNRKSNAPNLHENPTLYAMKPSSRFKVAKLFHFIPAGPKKRSRKESQKSEVGGYHYQRVQDRLRQKEAGKHEKGPSMLYKAESII